MNRERSTARCGAPAPDPGHLRTQLDGSEYAGWLKALRLFAHGTYSEFKGEAGVELGADLLAPLPRPGARHAPYRSRHRASPPLLCAPSAPGAPAADRSSYPELSARAAWKLKQLSLMTTAAKNARPAYDDLQRDLDLASPAEVERLAISCIDAGLLDAKLNQVSFAELPMALPGSAANPGSRSGCWPAPPRRPATSGLHEVKAIIIVLSVFK